MTIWSNAFRFGKTQSRKYKEFLISKLPNPESIRETWIHRWFGEGIFRPELWIPTRHSLAMGLAVGWFFGMLPIFGLQIAFTLILGFFLRCHFPTAVLGTFISNPLTTPAILVLQYGIGLKVCRGRHLDWFSDPSSWSLVLHHGIPLGLGALISAVATAILGYGVVWLAWGFKKSPAG